MNKHYRWLIATMMLSLVITGCSSSPLSSNQPAASLSLDQIQELRKEYPLSFGSPQNVELRDLTFKEVLNHTDSVIIAEVVQQEPNFSVDLPADPETPEGKLIEKQREAGIEPYKPEFISYQVKVEEIITGEDIGGTINIFYNSDFMGMEPDLKPGMKIVTAVKKGVGDQQEKGYSFTRYGTYYIVEENYVLSAYEGQSEEMKSFTSQTNGKSLENLILEIKELVGD